MILSFLTLNLQNIQNVYPIPIFQEACKVVYLHNMNHQWNKAYRHRLGWYCHTCLCICDNLQYNDCTRMHQHGNHCHWAGTIVGFHWVQDSFKVWIYLVLKVSYLIKTKPFWLSSNCRSSLLCLWSFCKLYFSWNFCKHHITGHDNPKPSTKTFYRELRVSRKINLFYKSIKIYKKIFSLLSFRIMSLYSW